jgi:O-antigen/teichoic acid export membrane protein
MTKEISINLDKADKHKYIKKIINNTISFQFINSFLLFVLFSSFLAFEYFEFFKIQIFNTNYLIYILILGIIYQAKSFIFSYLRIYERINEIVKIEFFSSLFVFIGIYFFVDDFGIDAIFIVSIIGNLLLLISYLGKLSNFKFFFEIKIIRILIYVGVPLLLFNLLSLMITTIDRIMINQLVSSNREVLGIYHTGYLLSFGVMTAFNSVIFLLVPKILKQFYSSEKISSLMINQTRLTEFILVTTVVISINIISPFIEVFLEDYKMSILVMQLLLLAYFMKGLAFLPESYLIANNRQMQTLPIFFISLLNAFLLNS